MRVVQKKDEITADSKTQPSGSHECGDRGDVRPDQDLRGEKVRQMSLAVEVEVMESERSEAESTHSFGQLSMAHKLYGGCAAQASVCEERQVAQ